MSCPVKYRKIGDFHKYYSGVAKAPYLTIFVGGNHEASSHLWELFYGGWVAPNIYYMGAANVVRLGGVRIAGMSGIWNGRDYNKHHYERLPYSRDDIKSIYHVREIDTRRLLQLKSQVDICISHDWPRAIENHGNSTALFNMKPYFEQDSRDGTLGNQAATYVMDRLRPPYWFSAHMHCKFAATKVYEDTTATDEAPLPSENGTHVKSGLSKPLEEAGAVSNTHNADEIVLDMDEEDEELPSARPGTTNGSAIGADQHDTDLVNDENTSKTAPITSSVPSDLRAQLPAAFRAPKARRVPGQPTPPEVTNKTVRFLALDKCQPGREFLQLLEVYPHSTCSPTTQLTTRAQPKFEYDPEWLAITRVFSQNTILGKRAVSTKDLGEAAYRALIEKEQVWINENIVKAGKLEIPQNFVITAPIFEVGTPEIVSEGPVEYDNPQMQQFCDLVGIENKFFATQEERDERMRSAPAPEEERRDGGYNRGGFRGGRGRGHQGGRGRGEARGGRRGRGW